MLPISNIIPTSQVASAYSTGATKATQGTTNFSSMVNDAAESALNTLRQAEKTTANGVTGKADVQEVVQALTNAELTMQTVVAVRDKVLSAYNDVMHMTV